MAVSMKWLLVPAFGLLVHSLIPFSDPKHSPFDGKSNAEKIRATPVGGSWKSNSAGIGLYMQEWIPEQNVKAIVFILHGIGEYCERYDHVAKELNKHQIAVFMLDHQGHGRSDGDRNHVEAFQDYIDDVFFLVRTKLDEHKAYASLPRFLYGHSMGSLIALHSIMKSAEAQMEWSGLVVTATPLLLDPKIDTPVNRFLAGTLSKYLPKLVIPWEKLPVDERLSTVTEVETQYKADPLVYHGALRIRHSNEFLLAVDAANAAYDVFRLPILGIHGKEDKLCIPAGTEQLLARAPAADKEFVMVENAYHEVHNEKPAVQAEVFAKISQFILAHLSPPKPVDSY